MPGHIHDLTLELIDERLPDATEVSVRTSSMGSLLIYVHDGARAVETTIARDALATAPELAELIRTVIEGLANELEGADDA